MAGVQAFIGRRISLVSKAEIRYEGTLYNINMNDATVALQDVKSYGTEEREVAQKLEGSSEVYEYIIFRGSDIKALHVCEEQAPVAPAAPPSDPAIVSTKAPPAVQRAPPPGMAASQPPQSPGRQSGGGGGGGPQQQRQPR